MLVLIEIVQKRPLKPRCRVHPLAKPAILLVVTPSATRLNAALEGIGQRPQEWLRDRRPGHGAQQQKVTAVGDERLDARHHRLRRRVGRLVWIDLIVLAPPPASGGPVYREAVAVRRGARLLGSLALLARQPGLVDCTAPPPVAPLPRGTSPASGSWHGRKGAASSRTFSSSHSPVYHCLPAICPSWPITVRNASTISCQRWSGSSS